MESSNKLSVPPPSAVEAAGPVHAADAVTIPVPPPINRELSLLAFNRRVLALAEDADVPLLERLRFLCIVGSNLDEFFEIRIAGLKEQLRAKVPPSGMTLNDARESFVEVGEQARALIADQYRVLNEQVLPALAERGVRLVRRTEFTAAERAWVARYFEREVRPLLTPIGLDPAHPFPQVVNKSLNFVIELTGKDAFGRDTGIAIVKAPRVLPRIIKVPREVSGGDNDFVMLSSVIHAHLHELFPGRDVVNYSQFRVTRDADLWIDEEEVKNLRQALQGELPQRQFGSAVRLEVAENCPAPIAQFLLQQFELTDADLYRCDGPVNIARLSSLIDQVDIDALKFAPFVPGLPDRLRDAPDILSAIRRNDILLHHPYQSFEPVVEFIRCAAEDPEVVAIKQTVYRTGVNSVLMEALIEAAKRGQGSDGGRRVDGALRRGGQHQLGRAAGARRRAGRLWRVRPQDACEAGAAHSPRARPAGPRPPGALCAPRHRQLPSPHDAALHGLRPADGGPGHLRRRERGVPAHHEPGEGGAPEAAPAGAVHDASARAGDDPARNPPCAATASRR